MIELSTYSESSVSVCGEPTLTIKLANKNSSGFKISPAPMLHIDDHQIEVRVIKNLIGRWEKKMGVIK